MSNFIKCINKNLKSEEFLKEAEGLTSVEGSLSDLTKILDKKISDEYNVQLAKGFAPEDAEINAINKVSSEFKEESVVSQRRRVNQALANTRNKNFIKNTENAYGDINDAQNAAALLDSQSANANYNNYETRKKGHEQTMFSLLDGMLGDQANVFTRKAKDPVFIQDIIRSAWNPRTKNTSALKQFTAIKKVTDFAFDRLYEAGAMTKKKDFKLPYHFNADKINNNKAGFVEFLKTKIDWDTSVDAFGKSYNMEELDTVIKNITNNITDITQFDSNIRPGHRSSRKLEFKDAEAFIEFQDKFGDSFLTSMSRYINESSDAIAKVETFGANPDSGINYIRGVLKANTPDAEKSLSKYAMSRRNHNIRVFNAMAKNSVERKSFLKPTPFGLFLGQTKSFLNASVTGSSLLTNIPLDLGKAMQYTGIHKTSGVQVIDKYFQMMSNTAPKEYKDVLKRLGFLSDNVARSFVGYQRNLGYVSNSKMFGNLTNMVYQANFMPTHSNYLRGVYGAEVNMSIASRLGKSFKDADKAFDGRLSKFGFDETDWKVLQKVEKLNYDDIEYLAPADILKLGKDGVDANTKLTSYIESSLQEVVAESSLRARTAMKFGEAGTPAGEFSQIISSFKNTPLTIMFSTLGNVQKKGYNFADASSFVAMGAIYSTVGGFISKQAKEVVKNGKPFAVDDEKLWKQSFAEYNDFSVITESLFRGTSYGNSLVSNPTYDFFDNAIKTTGSLFDNKKGWDSRRAVSMAKTMAPGANLFYTKQAMQKAVFDKLNNILDPAKEAKYQKRKKNASKKRKGL